MPAVTSLRAAIEAARSRGMLPPAGPVGAVQLFDRFRPGPPRSVVALMDAMYGAVGQRRPFAVILCRFKGAAPDPVLENPIKQFFDDVFRPGSGGLVEFWRDASLASIDIRGSRVFGWVEIDLEQSKAGGTRELGGPGREGLIAAAISAARQSGVDPLTGFAGQIAVLTHDFADAARGRSRSTAAPTAPMASARRHMATPVRSSPTRWDTCSASSTTWVRTSARVLTTSTRAA